MSRWAVVLVCGCGRLAFDPVEQVSDAATNVADADPDAASNGFAFVQGASQIGNNVNRVDVVVAQPFTVGNIVVVAIGTSDSPNIAGVTDDISTVYSLSIGPTSGGPVQQWMYVGIITATAATNTVHVLLSQLDNLPGAMVAEYSGVSTTTTLVTTSGNTAQSTSSSTGTFMINTAPALIVGANTNAVAGTAGPGGGFTERVRDTYEDIVEDRVILTPGMYVADAPLTTDHVWVMQAIVLAPQ